MKSKTGVYFSLVFGYQLDSVKTRGWVGCLTPKHKKPIKEDLLIAPKHNKYYKPTDCKIYHLLILQGIH